MSKVIEYFSALLFLLFLFMICVILIGISSDYLGQREALKSVCDSPEDYNGHRYGYSGNLSDGSCLLHNAGSHDCGYRVKCKGEVKPGFYKLWRVCIDYDEWGKCKEKEWVVR